MDIEIKDLQVGQYKFSFRANNARQDFARTAVYGNAVVRYQEEAIQSGKLDETELKAIWQAIHPVYKDILSSLHAVDGDTKHILKLTLSDSVEQFESFAQDNWSDITLAWYAAVFMNPQWYRDEQLQETAVNLLSEMEVIRQAIEAMNPDNEDPPEPPTDEELEEAVESAITKVDEATPPNFTTPAQS